MTKRRQELSQREQRIMEFLTRFEQTRGYPPTIREIGAAIGVQSTSLVNFYLNHLQEMSFIERDDHVSRSIRILKPVYATSGVGGGRAQATRDVLSAGAELLRIPVLGRIFASQPVPVPSSDLSYYDAESSVEVARSLLPAREQPANLFALEVQGDSMIDAMVYEGDIVILQPAEQANNGDMVAVWLEDRDETTLKYFYREPNRVRLQPANPFMDPIYIENPAHLRIVGKVIMVIRQVKAPLS